MVLPLSRQWNRTRTTSSTVLGTPPNSTPTKRFFLEKLWGGCLVSWVPKWESTEKRHFHSLEPYTKPSSDTSWLMICPPLRCWLSFDQVHTNMMSVTTPSICHRVHYQLPSVQLWLASKRTHILLTHKLFCRFSTPAVPGTNWVCPWDKLGLSLYKLGFHSVKWGENPGFGFVSGRSPGSSQGRRDNKNVYVSCLHWLMIAHFLALRLRHGHRLPL